MAYMPDHTPVSYTLQIVYKLSDHGSANVRTVQGDQAIQCVFVAISKPGLSVQLPFAYHRCNGVSVRWSSRKRHYSGVLSAASTHFPMRRVVPMPPFLLGQTEAETTAPPVYQGTYGNLYDQKDCHEQHHCSCCGPAVPAVDRVSKALLTSSESPSSNQFESSIFALRSADWISARPVRLR